MNDSSVVTLWTGWTQPAKSRIRRRTLADRPAFLIARARIPDSLRENVKLINRLFHPK
jgi:hypothetical protein